MTRLICGIDTGGTFTDAAVIDRDTGRVVTAKALSTPDDFSRGLFNSLSSAAEQLGVDDAQLLRDSEQIIVGTTVGTNAFLERRGASTGLLVTRGFRDTLHIMRGVGRVAGLPPEDAMVLETSSKPDPIVPKRLIREIQERVDSDGDVLAAPDRDEVLRAGEELVGLGVEAIAICLLWAFKAPEHERQVRDWLHEAHPGLYLSCSHEVAPKIGEYERFAATAINAYVGPVTRRYVEGVSDAIRERGYEGRLLVMGCNGGTRGVRAAVDEALVTLNSGPAGGVSGSATLAGTLGISEAITADVGGTSFDVGMVVQGEPERSDQTVLGQYEFFIPAIDVRSIGAGGGSIAWVDEKRGTLRVGPHSAGASPGPVCYGRGGTAPTLTDAALVLGYLSQKSFLGRDGRLDIDAARDALGELGERVGLDADQTAAGIVRIAEARMADLIRRSVVSRGLDPRDFAIFAFGGAGPLHAAGFARDLNVGSVVIPAGNCASVWSAYGVGTSDIRHIHEHSAIHSEPWDAGAISEICHGLLERGRRRLAEEEVDPKDTTFLFEAGLRYTSQLHEIYVPLSNAPDVTEQDLADTAAAFEAAYRLMYGEEAAFRSAGIEMVHFRLSTSTELERPDRVDAARGANGTASSRLVRFAHASDELVEAAILPGDALETDVAIEGPAVIELAGTSVVVPPGSRILRNRTGDLILTATATTTDTKGRP